jgi:2-polyprenyl-3-methyl-5-hydroxy-6-metoxy-1,4-benzoquinol methylase
MPLGQVHSSSEQRQCHHLNQRRLQFVVEKLKSYRPPSCATILEVGSGTGWLLLSLAKIFPEWEFIGIEPEKDFVIYAQNKPVPPNLRYLEGFGQKLDTLLLPEVDIILCSDVLHHINPVIEDVIRCISGKASQKNVGGWPSSQIV